jgi:hypothetical protein
MWDTNSEYFGNMNLQEFGPDIWIADGPAVSVLGPLTLPTRMVVVRLRDGSLWIDSPVEVTGAEARQVALLGNVRYLVSPTPLHDWRVAPWKEVFPDAAVWKRPFEAPPAAWAADLDYFAFEGSVFLSEVEFFHAKSRTLIMTDFLQNYPKVARRPFLNALTRAAGVQGVGVPLDIRLSFVRRKRARVALNKLLTWDFDNLIVAHGACVRGGAKALVERAFLWL